jgi:hypothetical protein
MRRMRTLVCPQGIRRARATNIISGAVGHRELATTHRYLRLGTMLEDHPSMLMDLLLPRNGRRKG